jgi:GEVED domain/Secretion system C-terminal sorting domain/Fibronectin type III domain
VPVPVSCGVPSGLTVSNLGNKSATFGWAAVPNATSYTLQYNLASNAGWLQVTGISGTTYTRSNLQIGVNYKFKVKAVCGAGSSTFSSEFTFSTLNCLSAGDNSAEWIDLFSLGTINRTSGAETGGYINTGLTTNLVIGSTGNQGQISAGFDGSVRNQNYSVYIDFNRNGNYNDAGERVYGTGGLINGNIQNFTFSIPSTATAGMAGLRVVMAKNGSGNHNACMENFQGETEDYTVNLTASSSRLSAENELITNDSEEIITVYPNPSSGLFKVNIPSNYEAKNFDIYGILGKMVISKSVENNEIEIDLRSEQVGMYLLNIQSKSGKKITKKLWKY